MDFEAMERANEQLAGELEKAFAAASISIGGKFFRTPVDWLCPCCHRGKQQLAYCKYGKLICQIDMHHDHFMDAAKKTLRHMKIPSYAVIAYRFMRFPGTFVCEDCNVTEGYAKILAKAPADFSFAPHEIELFVAPRNNQPHAKPDGGLARQIYEAAFPEIEARAVKFRTYCAELRADTRRCPVCGGTMAGLQADAQYCSDKCRVWVLCGSRWPRPSPRF